MAVVNFVWDVLSDNVLKETDSLDLTTVNYTAAPSIFGEVFSERQSGADHYYHFDGLGSTRNLTEHDEDVSDSYTYSAFGETVASSGLATPNPFKFNGAHGYYTNQETAEFYVRRRTYSPAFIRWLSRDPLSFDGSLRFLDGPNLYSYVGNQVPNEVDPSGLLRLGFTRPVWATCGGMTHRSDWKLDRNEQNGYIIQLVCLGLFAFQCPEEEEVDCENVNETPGVRCSGCYLEYWQVRDGDVVNPAGATLDDTFAFPSCDHTWGVNFGYGKSVFVPQAFMDNNQEVLRLFKTGNQGVAAAGGLPSVCFGPDVSEFWTTVTNMFDGTERFSYSQWNCCCNRTRVISRDSNVNTGLPFPFNIFDF